MTLIPLTSLNRPVLVLAGAIALALLIGAPALAGRALEEPPGLTKAIKRVSTTELQKAVASERCKGSLAPSSTDLLAFECRGAAIAAWMHAQRDPGKAKADTEARVALLADLVAAAGQVSTWAPLSPPPGLARARFDAHRALSAAAMTTLNDLISAGVKVDKPAKDGACGAAQRSLELAVGADATLEERGTLQALLTSHQCGLDESKLKVEPKPGLALKDSADAREVAASTSESGVILAYAQSRSIDLERCEKHLDLAGRPKDAKKLEQCACGAIGRWSLPKPKAATNARVPVVGKSSVDIEVAPTGAVAKCALAAP